MIKVLFVFSNRKGKGISPFIENQLNSLIKTGFVEIKTFSITKRNLIGYFQSISILKRIINKESFDIIHAHYGFSGVISKIAGFNRKVVVSFLGDDLMGNVKSNGSYSKKSKVLVFINKFFAKYFFDINIVKSQSLADTFFKNTQFIIIPNGVDLDFFTPIEKKIARNKIKLSEDEKYFLFLGDPKRNVKNYKLFEASLKNIKEVTNYKILILKGIDKENVNLYYNSADICVLSSLHEGSPNVIKEGMACNTIIVSTNVGDVNWLFGNANGYFISEPDPISFSKAIEKAILFEKQSLIPNGRERIKLLGLDNNNIAMKILDIYKSICKKQV
ncbi:MAG: glycosyltransferase [Bacteroidales bacterium]